MMDKILMIDINQFPKTLRCESTTRTFSIPSDIVTLNQFGKCQFSSIINQYKPIFPRIQVGLSTKRFSDIL